MAEAKLRMMRRVLGSEMHAEANLLEDQEAYLGRWARFGAHRAAPCGTAPSIRAIRTRLEAVMVSLKC